MKYSELNITELAVVLICGIGLCMSILYGQSDLSLAIGGGLVGYIGGATKSHTNQ